MKASNFPALLRELTIPGAEVRPADGKPGSGLLHGFIVTGQHGARMAWQVILYGDDDIKGLTGPPATFPASVPAQPDRLVSADVEASIGAWIGQSPAASSVKEIERYSATSRKRIKYGLNILLHNGERVFIQQIWALRPGEKPEAGNKYVGHESV